MLLFSWTLLLTTLTIAAALLEWGISLTALLFTVFFIGLGTASWLVARGIAHRPHSEKKLCALQITAALSGAAVATLFSFAFHRTLSLALHSPAIELLQLLVVLTTATVCWFLPKLYLTTDSTAEPMRSTAGGVHPGDLIVDLSALLDARLLDIAASGLIDNRLVLPLSLVHKVEQEADSDDEQLAYQAERTLDQIEKLKTIARLQLRFEKDIPLLIAGDEGTFLQFLRQCDAYLFSASVSRLQLPPGAEHLVINIHDLSQILKPLLQRGEVITVKVLRYGKEPRQGLGYLEDGSMVVINGGAPYMQREVRALVIGSRRSSHGGRMIFCNLLEEEEASADLVMQR